MLTRLLRTRPALGFALALLISAFVTLVGVGGAVAGADDSPGTTVFLGFIGGVGVLMLVSFSLEGVVPQEPLPVLQRSGARVSRARLAPYGWNGDVRTSDERVLGIETRHLSVDEKTLAFVLLSYQQHHELREHRDQLGTPASLDWRILDPST